MRKLIILILCIGIFHFVNAQVPGYMGKKFSVIYSPGVSFPQFSGLSGSGITLTPTFHNALRLEYVFAKHGAVGLRYKNGYTSAKNDSRFSAFQGYTKRHTFMSHTFGAYVKFYRKKLLAPLGRYFSLGVNFQNLNLKNLILEEQNSSSSGLSASKANYVKYDVGLSAAAGNNWLVGGSLILGFEFEFMPTLLSLRQVVDGAGSQFENSPTNNVVNRFNFTSEILKLSLNVGFLAF